MSAQAVAAGFGVLVEVVVAVFATAGAVPVLVPAATTVLVRVGVPVEVEVPALVWVLVEVAVPVEVAVLGAVEVAIGV